MGRRYDEGRGNNRDPLTVNRKEKRQHATRRKHVKKNGNIKRGKGEISGEKMHVVVPTVAGKYRPEKNGLWKNEYGRYPRQSGHVQEKRVPSNHEGKVTQN